MKGSEIEDNINLVFVGESKVGKTSLIASYLGKQVPPVPTQYVKYDEAMYENNSINIID